jgi:predicted deacylase
VILVVAVIAVVLWRTMVANPRSENRTESSSVVPTVQPTSTLAITATDAEGEEDAQATAAPPTKQSLQSTAAPSAAAAQPAAAAPLATATPPSTAAPPPTAQAAIDASLRWSSIGQSVRGLDLALATMGDTRGPAVVIVGSIQGDQPNTRDLVNHLIDDLDQSRDRFPANVAFHIVPTINTDGNASGTRRNANNVDLNRNWDSFDWTADPEQPEGVVRGAGGSRPHSEPETRSLASYLQSLQGENRDVRLVLFHSSHRIRSGGHVYPGYTSEGLERQAIELAQRYARSTGYSVREDWAPYETTGEIIAWCAERGIAAIDIVVPRSLSGSDQSLRNETMAGVLEVARFP